MSIRCGPIDLDIIFLKMANSAPRPQYVSHTAERSSLVHSCPSVLSYSLQYLYSLASLSIFLPCNLPYKHFLV